MFVFVCGKLVDHTIGIFCLIESSKWMLSTICPSNSIKKKVNEDCSTGLSQNVKFSQLTPTCTADDVHVVFGQSVFWGVG